MHEQSETYQDDNGQYYLGYGRGTAVPGQRLPNTPSFPTPEAAEPYAVQRSRNTSPAQEAPLAVQRAWERAAAGGTSPFQPPQTGGMNVLPVQQPGPRNWGANFPTPTPSTDLPNLPKMWLDWRLQQVPTVESLAQGDIPFMPGGIVKNVASPVFQNLVKAAPRFAGALEKVPQILEYTDKPAEAFRRGVAGVTTAIPPQNLNSVAADVAAGKVYKGPVQLTPEDIGRLVDYSRQAPGSSLQSIRPSADPLATTFHEAIHGLWAPKQPMTQAPNLTPARSHELMVRILSRTDIPMSQKIAILGQYNHGTAGAHGVVESLAQYMAAKARGGMGVGVQGK